MWTSDKEICMEFAMRFTRSKPEERKKISEMIVCVGGGEKRASSLI